MEANKVLLIFETLAPSAFIFETSRVGGAGLGAAGHVTGSEATWPGRGLCVRAPTDCVAGGAGSAAPWWGLFMAVPGSPTFFPVVVDPFGVEATELEVKVWRAYLGDLEPTGVCWLPRMERNPGAGDKGLGRGAW